MIPLDRREVLRYMRMGKAEPAPTLLARIEALIQEAPLADAKTCWAREGDCVYLCGTLGAQFDTWQRRVALLSATDALISQAIGADGIEKVMDALEDEVRATLAPDEALGMRRSPGYGTMKLSLNSEIIEKTNARQRIGLMLTQTNLLVPTKSVTAIARVERTIS